MPIATEQRRQEIRGYQTLQLIWRPVSVAFILLLSACGARNSQSTPGPHLVSDMWTAVPATPQPDGSVCDLLGANYEPWTMETGSSSGWYAIVSDGFDKGQAVGTQTYQVADDTPLTGWFHIIYDQQNNAPLPMLVLAILDEQQLRDPF